MKRAHDERARTLRVWRQHLSSHGSDRLTCICEFQPGRFRKGQRVGGCGQPRCYLCKRGKLCQVPTRQQQVSNISYDEWLEDLGRIPRGRHLFFG